MLPFKKCFEICDSEPEILLLQELILLFKLELKSENTLSSNEVVLICQHRIDGYRVDFLINNDLVIEVDGRGYHENDNSFYSDRVRDQDLMEYGYRVVRFTASQIYGNTRVVAFRIVRLLKLDPSEYSKVAT